MKIHSVVTTTESRKESYLRDSLASLESAGFFPTIHHDDPPTGAYQAFLAALRASCEHEADAVIVWQDDIEVAAGLHDWLQERLWEMAPVSEIGCLSLYLARSQDPGKPGWHRFTPTPGPKGTMRLVPFGALAFCFPMHAAKRLVANPPTPTLLHNTCTHVGRFCYESGLSFWHHSPSLVRHIGVESAVADHWNLLDHQTNPHRNCGEWLADVRSREVV